MKRVITALVALPILIASILVELLWPLFVTIIAAATIVGLYEFWLLAKRKQIQPDIAIGFGGAAALLISFFFDAPKQDAWLMLVILIGFTIALLISGTLRGAPFDKIIMTTSTTAMGVLYIVFLGGHLIAVRVGFKHGLSADLLSFFFLVIMGSDTGAFYTGSLIGKHKLAPKISPGKTWEGAVGGMVASLALALVAHFTFFKELSLVAALVLAAVMNALGVLGDLAESAFKRGSNTKDAAQIIPGHGGVLDRLDSLLFNAPVIYYFARVYFG